MRLETGPETGKGIRIETDIQATDRQSGLNQVNQARDRSRDRDRDKDRDKDRDRLSG
jgi:hypothetical protein